MNILQEADSLIHGDRNKAYGHALDEYTRVAGMVNSALASKLKEPLTADDMLLFMTFVKLSRHVNNPSHRDSMTDACGYIGLMEEVQIEINRRESSNQP
jgi:hypothetical protein